MKRNALLLLLFSFFSLCSSQELPLAAGSPARSMAGIRLVPNDVWTVYNAPGNMLSDQTWRLGLHYASPYGIDALKETSVAVLKSNSRSAVGLFSYWSGYHVSYTWSNTLSVALRLSASFRAGLSLHYSFQQVHGRDDTRLQRPGCSFSTYNKLSKNVSMSFLAVNPFGERNSHYLLGVQYTISNETEAYLQTLLNPAYSVSTSAGLRHRIGEKIYLSGGIGTSPAVFSFGAAFKFSSYSIQTALSRHSLLGFSPATSIEWRH